MWRLSDHERRIKVSTLVEETIRELYEEYEEGDHIGQKFKKRSQLVDKYYRLSISKIQMKSSVMKCYYR